MATDNIIQKAAKIGDTRQNKKGQTEVYIEYKPGKFDWRVQKRKKDDTAAQGGGGQKPTTPPSTQGQGQNSTTQQQKVDTTQGAQSKPSTGTQPKGFEDMTPDEIVSYAESAATNALEAVVNDKKQNKDVRQIAFNVLRKRSDYDKTKVDSSDLTGGHTPKKQPKIQYQKKRPADGVEFEVPDEWKYPFTNPQTGRKENKTASASAQRALYSKKTDDEIINLLKNDNLSANNAQLVYEEAASRGIPEDKIHIPTKLQNQWDALKRRKDLIERQKTNITEEEADAINIDFKGLDAEEFMEEKFPDPNDIGWLNPNDSRIQKKFDLKTSIGRQQYDAFLTYYAPTVPGYLDARDKVAELCGQYEDFMLLDTAPMFISAGGAGAGKTYSWEEIAAENNLPEFIDDGTNDPNDQDWAWVKCNDCEEESDLRELLERLDGTYIDENGDEHGRILVFDDADKLITTKSKTYIALLKKLMDNKASNRIYKDSSGNTRVFKGRIVVMTNKDVATIASTSPDMSAIMSRVLTNDMKFTRAESMDLIRDRYQDIKFGDFQTAFEKLFPTKEKQKEARQMVMDWLEDNWQDADPAQFTPRIFIQIMSKVGPKIARGLRKRATASGVRIGTSTPWEIDALNLIKGEDDDLNSDDNNFTAEGLVAKKEKLERMKKELKKKNKKKYNIIFGKKSINDFIFGAGSDEDETKEDDTEKAIMSDFGDMSIDDAKSLLLN